MPAWRVNITAGKHQQDSFADLVIRSVPMSMHRNLTDVCAAGDASLPTTRTKARVVHSAGEVWPHAPVACSCSFEFGLHLASQLALAVLGVCAPPSTADATSGWCCCP